jgi:GDSL-like Lipase/Acylhydrolase family/N-terminus of Esterase_SGNH_hydro-type
MKLRFSPISHQTLGLICFPLAVLATALNAQEPKPAPNAQAVRPMVAESAEAESEAARPGKLDCAWLPFPDNAKFKVLGLFWFEENKPELWRMPAGHFDSLPKGVTRQARQPTGGRILLRCDTANLGLKVLPSNKANLRGFDVYVNGKFVKSTYAEEPKVEAELVLFKDLDKKEKEIIIYLPSNQGVLVKAIGVDRDTRFSAPTHPFAKPLPVVFYGSSVCQGNGALKPGMTYPAKLCRDLNLDFINLGFGGAGKAEPAVVDLVSSIPACCYIFDLGKSYGMQDSTAFKKMLQTVRKAHPGVPLVCLTPITSAREVYSASYASRSQHTRDAMRQATNEFIQSGEPNVVLLEGTDLLGFGEHDGLSRDGVHPTDYGYSIIAGKILPPVKKALGL